MSDYHRLSVVEKRSQALARMREPFVSCPHCYMQVDRCDLLVHLEQRCAGPRPPGPGAKWIGWREAGVLGVPRSTLYRWADRGWIRIVVQNGVRRFLKGDLIQRITERRAVVVGVPKNGNGEP